MVRVLADDDRHAFSELVRRHQSTVRAFLRRLSGGQQALADDLAQETFLEAYRNLAKFRGGSAFATWLLGIAYNRFRNSRRREKPTVEWSGDDTPAEVAAGTDTTSPAPTAASDLRQDLSHALAQLSPAEQSALHLCYTEGLSHEEAAGVLSVPLGTVKTHVLRGKEKLRTLLRAWAPA